MSSAPKRLADFEILRRIGAGGMAEVFLAEKRGAEGTSKRLVVKRLLPDLARSEPIRAMFVNEAHIATRLDHPNVVHVHELVDHPTDGLLLAMEYVEGANLGEVVAAARRAGQPIAPAVAARIVEAAAKGLHYAHERRDERGEPLGIVHRDISPGNILVAYEGSVKVADLGIARARAAAEEAPGLPKGKVAYMAPEQARGEPVDRRADVYALGVVLYELVTLRSPYGERPCGELLRAVRAGAIRPPLAEVRDVPADLLPILRRALAPSPAGRFPTARDLAEALARALLERRELVDEGAITETVTRLLGPAPPPEITPAPEGEVAPAPKSSEPPQAEGPSFGPGDRFDRYVIEERLGRGGMAEVYQALDTRLGRRVALKLLRTDKGREARARLLFEAQAAATFEHPNSVVVFDVGEFERRAFIAMELVRGRPLSALLGDASIPPERRLRWLVGVARALAAAHRTGLVHRDVKPSNVMIRDDGEVKVLDFGIARRHAPGEGAAELPLTAVGAVVGTLRYAAPEQLRGDRVDGRADQFSWGMTAYELCAGRPPWTGDDTLSIAAQIFLEPAPSLREGAPGLPDAVIAAVDRALSKDPEDRFASLDEAADALEPFAEVPTAPRVPSIRPSFMSSPPGAEERSSDATTLELRPPLTTAPPPPAPPRPRRWARAGAALAIGAALIGLALRLRDPRVDPAVAAGATTSPIVDAFQCSSATVDDAVGRDLADAIGIGACARLGVETGAEWGAASAPHALAVRAQRAPAGVTVELRLGGHEASATAATPLEAVNAAVGALAARLPPVPLGERAIQLWGARDAASARRIQRVWLRKGLGLSPSLAAEVQRLVETDPESPFPHLLVVFTSSGDNDALHAARDRALARMDRLPPSRAHMLRGVLLAFPAELDRDEAVRLMRASYAEAPEDADMVALYAILAIRMGLPEAFGIVDRLHARAPMRSLTVLENAIARAPDRDLARSARYVAWSIEALPEVRASTQAVRHLVAAGALDEARAALDFGRRLGVGAVGEPLLYETGRIDVELAALHPGEARSLARPLLGDPRIFASSYGAIATAASYLMEGRASDAEAALIHETDRLRGLGDVGDAAEVMVQLLRLRRWLRRPAGDPGKLAWLEEAVPDRTELVPVTQAEVIAELALARDEPGAPGRRAAALRQIEEEARRAPEHDRARRDEILVQGVALTRAVRGDREAAALWRATERAPLAARLRVAVDAALALESIGDHEGAERAYRFAEEPGDVREGALQRAIASARLGALHRRTGRTDEAAQREAVIDRLWGRADPGLREAVGRMR